MGIADIKERRAFYNMVELSSGERDTLTGVEDLISSSLIIPLRTILEVEPNTEMLALSYATGVFCHLRAEGEVRERGGAARDKIQKALEIFCRKASDMTLLLLADSEDNNKTAEMIPSCNPDSLTLWPMAYRVESLRNYVRSRLNPFMAPLVISTVHMGVRHDLRFELVKQSLVRVQMAKVLLTINRINESRNQLMIAARLVAPCDLFRYNQWLANHTNILFQNDRS